MDKPPTKTEATASAAREERSAEQRRAAILEAAKDLFYAKGFDATTTDEIASRARVSKRTIYEMFATKREMLSALIAETSDRMSAPIVVGSATTRAQFLHSLREFGLSFLRELSDPEKIAMYRLAVTASHQPGPVARELMASGRKRVSQVVGQLFGTAAAHGILPASEIPRLVPVFFYVLIGQLQIDQMLGLEEAPAMQAIEARVDEAVYVIDKLTR